MSGFKIALATLALWGLALAETTAAQAPEGVQQLLERYGNAVDAGDAEAAAALYAEGARIYTAEGEVLSSPEAITRFHRGMGEVEGATTEGLLLGEDAWFEIGTYTAVGSSESGEELEESGGYTALMRREGEAWRFYRVVLYDRSAETGAGQDG